MLRSRRTFTKARLSGEATGHPTLAVTYICQRYYEQMVHENAQPRRRTMRRVLITMVVIGSILVVGAVAVILIPILTHHSAGGSGQAVPDTIVSETTATGADDRTRTLAVETTGGEPADLSTLHAGDVLVVRGSGYDAGIGIYVSICAVPAEAGQKPSPCLGGLPDGAMEEDAPGDDAGAAADPETSVWITDDWAWKSFATQGYDEADAGVFTARLLVAEPTQEGLDCTVTRCAVTTRADHTAATDRVQDVQLPVAFAG